MKQKVLYISYDGMTDPLGQSQVLPYLSGLAQDYEIHLLSCEKPKAFEKSKTIIQSICDENFIQWHPIQYHKSPPVVSTIYDYYKLRSKAFELHRKLSFSLTHCRSYLPAMVGLELKNKKGVKFLFDMRGFWADERKESGSWNTSNPLFARIYRFFKEKEKRFFTESDAIISLTHAGKTAIKQMDLQGQSPMSIIPCCADFQLFDYQGISAEQSKKKKIELGYNENDFILTYLGSLGGSYMMKEMMKLFKYIKSINNSSKFLVITKSDHSTALEAANNIGVNPSDIKFIKAERTEIPLILSATNASVFFYLPTFSRKGTSPTKLPELMGLGIPVIGNKGVGDVEDIISTATCGVVVDIHDDASIFEGAKKLVELSKNPEKESIRTSGIELFNLEDGIKKYNKVYKEILI